MGHWKPYAKLCPSPRGWRLEPATPRLPITWLEATTTWADCWAKPGSRSERWRIIAARASIREVALQSDRTNLLLNSHLAADYAGMAQSVKPRGDLMQAIQLQGKEVETLEQI